MGDVDAVSLPRMVEYTTFGDPRPVAYSTAKSSLSNLPGRLHGEHSTRRLKLTNRPEDAPRRRPESRKPLSVCLSTRSREERLNLARTETRRSKQERRTRRTRRPRSRVRVPNPRRRTRSRPLQLVERS